MKIFRYADDILPNAAALGYVAAAYPLALAGLAAGNVLVWLLSCLLLAHSLVISAYLVHECIHNSLFRRNAHNRLLGQALAWLTGAACTPYDVLRDKHLRHHADRVDTLNLDYRELLAGRPRLRQCVAALQYGYIPVAEVITRLISPALPWLLPSRQHYKRQALLVTLSRLAFLLVLALIDWKILPGYLLAWLLFVGVLGFMDAYQHWYEVRRRPAGAAGRREFDRAYEEAHTYSNLLSTRYPVLNLLVLNFCYHNVHHYKPGIPWHALPAAHADRYHDRDTPVVGLARQLRNYHRYRVVRALDPAAAGESTGAAGLSFLAGV